MQLRKLGPSKNLPSWRSMEVARGRFIMWHLRWSDTVDQKGKGRSVRNTCHVIRLGNKPVRVNGTLSRCVWAIYHTFCPLRPVVGSRPVVRRTRRTVDSLLQAGPGKVRTNMTVFLPSFESRRACFFRKCSSIASCPPLSLQSVWYIYDFFIPTPTLSREA